MNTSLMLLGFRQDPVSQREKNPIRKLNTKICMEIFTIGWKKNLYVTDGQEQNIKTGSSCVGFW